MRAQTCVMLLFAGTACLAQEARQPVSLHLSMRPRYEFVDQENSPDNAHALTLRTLAAAHIEPGGALKGRVEVINVTQVVDHFNDTRNQQLRYPVVRDPEDTDFNQVYAEYGPGDTTLRAGRQTPRINRTRFIGTGDFRQLIQTFTGLSVETQVRPLGLYYARFERVATTAGVDRQLRLDVARADYSWKQGNSLLASGYWHDQPVNGAQTGFTDSSYRIAALRWDGLSDAVSGARLNHTVEYAWQRAYSGGDSRIGADYLRIGGGVLWPGLFLRVDHEKLGSRDGQYGFQTPIGNNHIWQGWADLFNTTPAEGLRDWWMTLGGSRRGTRWVVEHHRFKADFGDIDFGYETDVGATRPVRKTLLARAELAAYRRGDDPLNTRPSTTKLWLAFIWSVR